MTAQCTKMDIDPGYIGNAGNRIVIEIALNDAPVLHREALVEGHVVPKQRPALQLGQHRIVIHDATAVECEIELMHLDRTARLDLDGRNHGDCGTGLRLAVTTPVSH